MPPTFVFFDQNKNKIDEYEEILNSLPNVKFICGTLDEIL